MKYKIDGCLCCGLEFINYEDCKLNNCSCFDYYMMKIQEDQKYVSIMVLDGDDTGGSEKCIFIIKRQIGKDLMFGLVQKFEEETVNCYVWDTSKRKILLKYQIDDFSENYDLKKLFKLISSKCENYICLS